jgi:hypothetical protein
MTYTEGRYDALADGVLRETDADAVILVVLGGNKGSGFTLSCKGEVVDQAHARLPALLREIADSIEHQAQPTDFRVTKRGESPAS